MMKPRSDPLVLQANDMDASLIGVILTDKISSQPIRRVSHLGKICIHLNLKINFRQLNDN